MMLKEWGNDLRETFESVTPDSLRLRVKRLYWAVIRSKNKRLHIIKGKRAELGYRFRFSRQKPYAAYIGEGTVTDEFNVWNAKSGDIIVGKECWFGLHNIVMGPVEIGDKVSTGPYVCILGPRHAVLDPGERKREKTVIGENVWISAGAIITFGTKIGDNSIIGPGSVVTKDVAEGAFVSGNPARDLTKIVGELWRREDLVREADEKGD